MRANSIAVTTGVVIALTAAMGVEAQDDDADTVRRRKAQLNQLSGPVPPPLPPSQNQARMLEEALAHFPEADRGEVLALAEVHFPLEMRRFSELAVRDEKGAMRVLLQVVRRVVDLIEVKRVDPQHYERLAKAQRLETLASNLADTTRHLAGDHKAKAVEQLNKVLDEAFQVRQQIMQHEVARMESELQRIKALLQKRDEHRSDIISRRLAQLTGSEALGW